MDLLSSHKFPNSSIQNQTIKISGPCLTIKLIWPLNYNVFGHPCIVVVSTIGLHNCNPLVNYRLCVCGSEIVMVANERAAAFVIGHAQ